LGIGEKGIGYRGKGYWVLGIGADDALLLTINVLGNKV
jgi:hypothetical protein